MRFDESSLAAAARRTAEGSPALGAPERQATLGSGPRYAAYCLGNIPCGVSAFPPRPYEGRRGVRQHAPARRSKSHKSLLLDPDSPRARMASGSCRRQTKNRNRRNLSAVTKNRNRRNLSAVTLPTRRTRWLRGRRRLVVGTLRRSRAAKYTPKTTAPQRPTVNLPLRFAHAALTGAAWC